jgi:hypothetical protein
MVKVLFDHNMPPALARGLHEIIAPAGHEAWVLRNRFDKKIDDISYFAELGKDDGWVVISKDVHNAKRRPAREAILRSGVLAFYLAPSVQRQRITEQAATILWHWEKIVSQRSTARNGLFLLPINKSAKFESL